VYCVRTYDENECGYDQSPKLPKPKTNPTQVQLVQYMRKFLRCTNECLVVAASLVNIVGQAISQLVAGLAEDTGDRALGQGGNVVRDERVLVPAGCLQSQRGESEKHGGSIVAVYLHGTRRTCRRSWPPEVSGTSVGAEWRKFGALIGYCINSRWRSPTSYHTSGLVVISSLLTL
jgi:hypothetical protein